MKKTLGTFIMAAALSTTAGVNAQAEEIEVNAGDTLSKLATVHNTTIDNIKAWNGLASDTIFAGKKLTILTEMLYEVEKGDTLWDIALEHHTSVEDLKAWNGLTGDLIFPGMELSVNGVKTAATDAAPVKKINPGKTVRIAKDSPVKKVKATNTVKAAPRAQKVNQTNAQPVNGKVLTMTATAYTASCKGCSGITATGINLKNNPGMKVISVDPSIIPLGSKVYVEGYGHAIAGDTGGAIRGNIIDVFIPSKDAALKWGRKTVKVTVLK
ncbi:LysM peptidoglycan-binding domain-containing protein [Neobacillus notoginsengisoli]|uniref:LysM peptidoglycan-binding domain-containing protein n=1 Tax=Neobacillus notoginsengisoli TaxID=1578198 RepID=A0A417YXC9_9BACI|nr:3D domain-containing protein [Neobacillus notoginsengisoli]RHW42206.1 LysM peptidoglycan-binding domain-containing protein [Neobacillus notoginsengisoli]